MKVKSYDGMKTSGEISIEYLPYNIIKNKKVLLIEDIVDSGLTGLCVSTGLSPEDDTGIQGCR